QASVAVGVHLRHAALALATFALAALAFTGLVLAGGRAEHVALGQGLHRERRTREGDAGDGGAEGGGDGFAAGLAHAGGSVGVRAGPAPGPPCYPRTVPAGAAMAASFSRRAIAAVAAP